MLIATLASCGGAKKEEADAPKKDSLVIPQATEVVGIGRIEPEGGLINLSSDQTGIIRQLLIKEGDSIRRSQIVLVLDNSVQNSQVAEAGRRLETERAQIGVNSAAIAEAEENLRKAEEDLVKTKRLVEKGAETKQKMDDAQADVNNKRIVLLWASFKNA
jgi:HlyD family secretion protein